MLSIFFFLTDITKSLKITLKCVITCVDFVWSINLRRYIIRLLGIEYELCDKKIDKFTKSIVDLTFEKRHIYCDFCQSRFCDHLSK